MVVVSVVSALVLMLVHPGVVLVIVVGVMMEFVAVVFGGGGTCTGTRTGTGGVVVVWQ